jgi:hypothetical protein
MSEYSEQCKLVDYLDTLKRHGYDIKYTYIPNDTHTTSAQAKMKNTRLGLKGGIPDLFFIINNKPFFIEMKRTDGGILSDKQNSWIEAIRATKVIDCHVCYGYSEAVKIVEGYLV